MKLADSSNEMVAQSFPDYDYGAVVPEVFRRDILSCGAVMLRNAADTKLLDQIQLPLSDLYAQYASVPPEQFERHIASLDPVERNFWQEARASHIYDQTFKDFSGISYFDVVRSSDLWDLVARAFPESQIKEASVSHSRRIKDPYGDHVWNRALKLHVDAQYHYDEKLSINFWTPLASCGVTAPGLKVILLGVEETKRYLEFNPSGYERGPDDIARMHKFRCDKMNWSALEQCGFLERVWTPEFNQGDILALTNFTMHATHITASMNQPRMSIEVRIDIPADEEFYTFPLSFTRE